ncbi:MAG: hypothetical protein VKP62_03895 [Candidatus Sericytochromatia bacterium]|nr:hypothetical protein [Candidatus Sericytochromatia bacterium]
MRPVRGEAGDRRRGVSRRAFLGGLATLSLGYPLAACSPPPAPGRVLTGPQGDLLEALSEALWPAVHGLPGSRVARVANRAQTLLVHAPADMQDEVRLLVDTLDRFSWLSGRSGSLSSWPQVQRERYLAGWRDAPLALSARAWAGLVRLTGTLTYMSPASWPAIQFPGPWYGRLDVGVGLDHRRVLGANPNPHWDRPYPRQPEGAVRA